MRALGRNLLRNHLPDVLAKALARGSSEIDLSIRIPTDQREDADEELVILACRRPLLEAILRETAQREHGIEFRQGCKISGLISPPSDIPRAFLSAVPPNLFPKNIPLVEGVRTTSGETLYADVVVDASGRQSQVCQWLKELGATTPIEESTECGLIYYSRHFKWRPGCGVPDDMATLYGPRGALGCVRYATFLQDNDTFAITLMIPTWDNELRQLRHEDAYTAVVEHIPALWSFVDPARSQSISEVIPFGELRNRMRRFVVEDVPVALGLHVIGDAFCCTNPEFGWGMSLGMKHGLMLTEVMDESLDHPLAQALAFDRRAYAESRWSYQTSVDLDMLRKRLSNGEKVDPTNPTDDWAAFLTRVVSAAGTVDPTFYRASTRITNLLDLPEKLLENSELVERAITIYKEHRKSASPMQSGPGRDELLQLLR